MVPPLLWLTTLPGSAYPTTLHKKTPFSLCAVLLLNVSHTVNPPKAADPQTAASTQLEEEPATAREQLPGSAGMEISSCPFATEAIRTHSRALHWVLPRRRPRVPRHILRCQPYPLVCCTGGYNSRQRDPQRLGFPQGQAARSSCGCRLCRAAQDDRQPPPLPFLHQAGLQLLAPTTPGCSPRHTTLPPKRPLLHAAANSSSLGGSPKAHPASWEHSLLTKLPGCVRVWRVLPAAPAQGVREGLAQGQGGCCKKQGQGKLAEG